MGLFQKISNRVLHPLLLWRAGELDRLKFFSEFEKSQFFSSQDIRDLQRERLHNLTRHAFQNTKFYRDRFEQYGFNPDDSADDLFEQLCKLPPLTKSEIQTSAMSMISNGLDHSKLIKNQTGGSTGEPIRFYLDKNRYEARIAGMHRHDKWAGLEIGHRSAYVWGAPQDKPSNSWKAKLRNRLLGGQIWLDTSNITDEKIRDFVDQLKKFRPEVVVAYANAILMLARFCEENNIAAYQPKSIITSAELLTQEGRQTIERVFGCKVFNRYGCREFSVIGSECDAHDGLHLMSEGLLVEVDQNTLDADGSGDLLVTDLLNTAMPMIRYRIGDRGQLMTGDCECGRGLPRLKSVDGRVTDFLVGTSGQLVSGVFLATYLAAQRPSLGRVQIVQEDKGQALFKIKPNEDFAPDSDREFILETAKKHLGHEANVEIEQVEEFEFTRSGKVQFSVSKVLPGFAAVNE